MSLQVNSPCHATGYGSSEAARAHRAEGASGILEIRLPTAIGMFANMCTLNLEAAHGHMRNTATVSAAQWCVQPAAQKHCALRLPGVRRSCRRHLLLHSSWWSHLDLPERSVAASMNFWRPSGLLTRLDSDTRQPKALSLSSSWPLAKHQHCL